MTPHRAYPARRPGDDRPEDVPEDVLIALARNRDEAAVRELVRRCNRQLFRAARAILHALLTSGAPEIRLANRSRHRAEALADHFGPKIRVIDWDAAAEGASEAATIVNTTSLGMKGQPPMTLDLRAAWPEAVVTDIVYEPLMTPFLQSAADQGFRTVDGLGMLLHQGIPGFRAWFGGDPVVDEALRTAVMRE